MNDRQHHPRDARAPARRHLAAVPPDPDANKETTEPVGRALLYIRVSSSQQADTDYDLEGFSIPAQREACLRKAAQLGVQVVDEFVDRGESARTANRPAPRPAWATKPSQMRM